VPYPAVAVDFLQTLDIHGNLTAQISLDMIMRFDFLTKFRNIIVCQILGARIGVYTCRRKDFLGGAAADAINIGKGNFNPLLIRNVNACYTSHSFYLSVSVYYWLLLAVSRRSLNGSRGIAALR
jgi:hypothetical protein